MNQLLDFQKLEAGKKAFALEPVNINRFTHVLGDYFASACSSKAIDFHVTRDGEKLDPERVVPIMGETDSLEKVAFNFPLKCTQVYTRAEVVSSLVWRLQSRESAKLYVQDLGLGSVKKGSVRSFRSLVRSRVGRRA